MVKDFCGEHSHVFGLCTAEMKAFEAWRKEHRPVCKIPIPVPTPSDPLGLGGVTGEANFSVEILMDAASTCVDAKCACGAKKDITHWDHA